MCLSYSLEEEIAVSCSPYKPPWKDQWAAVISVYQSCKQYYRASLTMVQAMRKRDQSELGDFECNSFKKKIQLGTTEAGRDNNSES